MTTLYIILGAVAYLFVGYCVAALVEKVEKYMSNEFVMVIMVFWPIPLLLIFFGLIGSMFSRLILAKVDLTNTKLYRWISGRE